MGYPARIYNLGLHETGLIIGLVVLLAHLYALLRPIQTQHWLRQLPRSRTVGIGIVVLDAIWSLWLVTSIDLEEFSFLRPHLQIGIPVLAVLSAMYLDEFLAARALGIFGMLVAAPMLAAAFLKPEETRLLLVVLAYVWLTVGMFWVGKPYLLRDQITWLLRSRIRYQCATGLGVAWGAAIFLCAFFWRS